MKLSHKIKNYFQKSHVMYSPRLKRFQWNEFDDKLVWAAFDTYQWHIENDITLKYLDWCMTELDEAPSQVESAKEMLAIYNWWLSFKKRTEEIEKEMDSIPEAASIDYWMVAFDKEDKLKEEVGEYLHRLVDIRNCVWS